jgi:Fe-S oxidoreductase
MVLAYSGLKIHILSVSTASSAVNRLWRLNMFSEKIMIQEAEKCSRCGVCAAVCPVFRELQRETYSSRGKTEIAKALAAGELPYSSYTEEIFIKCLLCLTCKGACPSGVDQGKLVLGIRAELAKRRGLPLSKRIAFRYLLKNRSTGFARTLSGPPQSFSSFNATELMQ